MSGAETSGGRGARVYVETYGCAFNVADGEAMAGVLAGEGYRVVEEAEGADVVVLNTCTVKDRTYLNFEKRLAALCAAERAGTGPRVVVAGCIPRAQEGLEAIAGLPALGPETLGRVGEVVEGALRGEAVRIIRGARTAERLGLPTRRKDPLVEIIPISSGCLSACTFCQTRFARGTLNSFAPGEILRRARGAAEEGVAEIWLTSQDTGAWGREMGYSLGKLLKELCAIEGDFRVRLGMSSPQWAHEGLEEWLEALDHPKMFQFLHLPVQSGSESVLRGMKRGGTAAQFAEVGEAFMRRFARGGLMTDIIVGFPGETEEDFTATLELLERTRPAAVNCSRFSARPGTLAAKMKPVAGGVVAKRMARLGEVVQRISESRHGEWVGLLERVRVAKRQRRGVAIAHNCGYRPVVLEGDEKAGEWVDVEYMGARGFHLEGRIG